MIIALDGPSASGKGIIGSRIAERLCFAYLDTGLLFRAIAYQVICQQVNPEDRSAIIQIAKKIANYSLGDPQLRTEEVGNIASLLACIPEVRDILVQYERDFGNNPPSPYKGAVLDGRDIGTIIFPEADCKIFVTAHVETRALRRHNQLIQSEQKSIYSEILRDLKARDERDMQRIVAPLMPASDALYIDTTDLSIDLALEKIFSFITRKREYLIHDEMREAV
ncbi:MAG: (d)CMP kinase [Alphaproteobacteria bacterium]|nr:(d)CMP kinase [Alphaproteobacteria bacterium]